MKKICIITFIITLLILPSNKNEIPDESIRMRVIANSNSNYDQQIKKKVSNNLKQSMYTVLKDTDNIEKARTEINKNLTFIEKDIEKTLKDEKYNLEFKMNYGMNYFPEKEHDGKTYKEGEYESLVVTLGKGEGDNWWCVLFPPLCMIEAKEGENEKDVEYKSFFAELIDKLF